MTKEVQVEDYEEDEEGEEGPRDVNEVGIIPVEKELPIVKAFKKSTIKAAWAKKPEDQKVTEVEMGKLCSSLGKVLCFNLIFINLCIIASIIFKWLRMLMNM